MITRKRPQKSLRAILMFWFLLFSIVPLAFITGYSIVKYEEAIDKELSKRLSGNGREISVIISEMETALRLESKKHAEDRRLIYFLTSNQMNGVRELVEGWLTSSLASRIWVYNREGWLQVALYRNGEGRVERKRNLESTDVYLNETFLKESHNRQEIPSLYIHRNKAKSGMRDFNGQIELGVYHKLLTPTQRLVGYLEEVVTMDDAFMKSLKNRLNVEIFAFREDLDTIVATHEDLSEYKPKTLIELSKQSKADGFFEINIRGEPYRFMLQKINWGGQTFTMGLGASKIAAKAILQNVNYAFFSVISAIVLLLIVLSLVISRVLMRPLYDVLNAIEKSDFHENRVEIPATQDTELGLLAQSFNEMSGRVYEAQSALKNKISELEKANMEIRDTQSRLVHTAKMVSLGQLVAGIAHELNNPIGFIYSNMGHLREYSDKLIHLIDEIEKEGVQKLSALKDEIDFEYIRQDLPRLIQSCEDGARRTRDIVVGLRNFSRLEESQVKEVDIHEGIETTLHLLTGEIKNRIEVVKEYGKIPPITCYASQLNQVFMNILSNAAQAIEGEGEILIRTKMSGKNKVIVTIKDSGIGMSKATLEKIFDPFYTTKSLGTGTGLGLSISYGIVQKHGGDIRVSSQPGKGTEFQIELPLKVDPSV